MSNQSTHSRREFIRRMTLLGLGASAYALTGCSPDEVLEEMAATTSVDHPITQSSAEPTAAATDAPQLTEEVGLADSSQVNTQPTSSSSQQSLETQSDHAGMAVVHGDSPTDLVHAALNALGGIERFVSPGDSVVIKPNIVAADYSYEYAVYTNPEVVAAVTLLCVNAGARQVKVMDRPSSGTCEQVYARSGIGDAVTAVGGQMEVMSDLKYRETALPEGRDLSAWNVYGDVLDADVVINVPIAKHHRLSQLTLSMKNLMGVITNRNQFHSNLGQRIADIASLVRPTLTIVDAVRILMDRGPRGGNLGDVKQTNMLIASPDFIAAGAYAATLFGKQGRDVDAIRLGAEMGLGVLDLNSVQIAEVNI
jgi:uncharacterized protein (DUF362 family)